MNNHKIAIIGGGNIGSAITNGFVNSKWISAANIAVSDPQYKQLTALSQLGIKLTDNNLEAVNDATIVIIAVKPWLMETVCKQISASLKSPLVISIAAGITAQVVADAIGKELPIFRVMPNTAIAIGESMTFVSSFKATSEQENLVNEMFNLMGTSIIIPEDQMSAATVLASCGIAFALRYIRASSEGGVEIGFGAKLAHQIVAQTVKGAAELILKNGTHPEEEIDKVCTPKGVTINGLNAMEQDGFTSAVLKGILSPYKKMNS